MGYKKLDEVMELLNDELAGFNRAVDRLERLTKNVDNINIKSDTSEIESILREHLAVEKGKMSKLNGSIQNIGERVSTASLIPKEKLWLHYSIWLVSLIIIGYLSFRISRIDDIREKAFAEGEQYTISSLRGYFDRNPEHYESYRKWAEVKDSVPNQK
ncbi:DUF6730 family protein [Pricia sp. S334]|uniref:DUF6730 family protein n=1 Tax=Pricia mediterranea TaxID=3076079 RepID=A0ABU3L5E3_9FLAO|nr:DUF6730 family protein [Pricia sp. S334]MDT7828855.1 DUF6730 family protein [Pricia sp. S334]